MTDNDKTIGAETLSCGEKLLTIYGYALVIAWILAVIYSKTSPNISW